MWDTIKLTNIRVIGGEREAGKKNNNEIMTETSQLWRKLYPFKRFNELIVQ